MATLTFASADILRIVAHARAAPDHQAPLIDYSPEGGEVYGPAVPAVMLVKDSGIYLMSSGLPRDIDNRNRSFVAYAWGFDPRTNDNCHDDSSQAVGGDDFSEFLSAHWLDQIEDSAKRNNYVRLSVTATTIKLLRARYDFLRDDAATINA